MSINAPFYLLLDAFVLHFGNVIVKVVPLFITLRIFKLPCIVSMILTATIVPKPVPFILY